MIQSHKLWGLGASLLTAGLSFWTYHLWTGRRPPEVAAVTSRLDILEAEGLPNVHLVGGGSIGGPEGKDRSLAEVAAKKAVLVNFWASWCEPCAREIPSMLRLVREFSGEVVLVLVSADKDASDARRFVETFKLGGLADTVLAWDSSGELQRQFGVERLPETFLFRRDGSFARKVIGVEQWFTPESTAFVRAEMLTQKQQ